MQLCSNRQMNVHIALAEHTGQKLGGDYSTFVDPMNKTATDLGCTDTHFNNANGLPDENHYTSAYDMGLIGCRLQE